MAITLSDLVCAYFDVDPKVSADNIRHNLTMFQGDMLRVAKALEPLRAYKDYEAKEAEYIRDGFQILRFGATEENDFMNTGYLSEFGKAHKSKICTPGSTYFLQKKSSAHINMLLI